MITRRVNGNEEEVVTPTEAELESTMGRTGQGVEIPRERKYSERKENETANEQIVV